MSAKGRKMKKTYATKDLMTSSVFGGILDKVAASAMLFSVKSFGV
jgi:hypothetical protein